MARTTTNHTPPESLPAAPVCAVCGGTGIEPKLPDMSHVRMAEMARATGLSKAMLSRMFSDNPEQKRPNPTLRTLQSVRDYLELATGQRIMLDVLVEALK